MTEAHDEPTGRDLRMVYKTIAVVGGLLAGAWFLAGPVWTWATDMTTNVKLIQAKVDDNQKRVERLERWRERMSVPTK